MMKFSEYLDKVKSGTATIQEQEYVQAELEKYETISDYLSAQVDEEFITNYQIETNTEEMRGVKRRINRKIWGIVMATVAAVGLLTFGGIFICNRYAYNPNRGYTSENTQKGQLMLDASAFTELHSPGFVTDWAEAKNTGPGSYLVRIHQRNIFSDREETYTDRLAFGKTSGSENLNSLFWHFPIINAFADKLGGVIHEYPDGEIVYGQTKEEKEEYLGMLRELPDSAYVSVYLTFKDNLTLQQFQKLNEKYIEKNSSIAFSYAAVEAERRSPVGFEPNGVGMEEGMTALPEENYPCFNLRNEYDQLQSQPVEVWKAHFTSLLKYLSDRPEFLKAFANVNGIDSSYYKSVLSYIELNGINIYGVLVNGKAKDVLKFYQEEKIQSIFAEDVKLSSLSH